MRLFIATPELHSKELERIRKEFSMEGITAVNSFHLTFKFLGDVKEDLVKEIVERLKEIKMKKFKIKLTKLGTFPNDDYFRVIWVGLEGDGINKLQEEIDDKLSDLFDKEKRFHAHITIGRVKFVKDRDSLIKKLKEKIKEEEFIIDKFVLYKSELTPNGARYEALEEIKAA